jgi:maltooligosyltrehalose synthase
MTISCQKQSVIRPHAFIHKNQYDVGFYTEHQLITNKFTEEQMEELEEEWNIMSKDPYNWLNYLRKYMKDTSEDKDLRIEYANYSTNLLRKIRFNDIILDIQIEKENTKMLIELIGTTMEKLTDEELSRLDFHIDCLFGDYKILNPITLTINNKPTNCYFVLHNQRRIRD